MPRSTSLQFMPSTVTRKRALSDKHEVMQKEAFNTFQQAAAPIRKSQSMLIDLTELKMDVGEDMNGEGVNSLTRINYPVKNSTSLDSVDSSKLSSKISSTNSPKANSPKGSPMGSPKVARTVSPSSSAKTSVKNLLKNAFSKSSSSLLSNKQKSASASALHSEDSLFENASKDSLLALDLQLSYLYSPAINSGGRDEGGSESPKGGVFNGDLNCSEEGSSSSASTRQQRDRVKMDIFKRAPKAAQMLLPPDNNNASGVNKKKKNSFAMQQSKKWLTKMLSGSHHPLPKPPDSMDVKN